MSQAKDGLLEALKDVIGYYERALECNQENPVLFALQMAVKVEEKRIQLNDKNLVKRAEKTAKVGVSNSVPGVCIKNKAKVSVKPKVDRDSLRTIHKKSIAGKQDSTSAMRQSAELAESKYSD